ncbi:MAG: hypothetical protein KC933_05525 [Myxococcales bacterium]|nr:hypothetical protein [Myxococcales bacterium]
MIDLMGEGRDDSRARVRRVLATCGAYLLPDHVVAQGEGWLEVAFEPPADAPWYRTDGAGHALLLPGTVTTELAVQAGELLIHTVTGGDRPEDGVPVLGRVRRARFTRPVPPGTALVARVALTQRLGPAFYVRAEVRGPDGVVMKASLTFTATKAVARFAGLA